MRTYQEVFQDIDVLVQKIRDQGVVKTQEQYEFYNQTKDEMFEHHFEQLPEDLWETVEESRTYFDEFYKKLDELEAYVEEYASLLFLARILEANEERNGRYTVEKTSVSQYTTPEVIRKAKGIQLIDEEAMEKVKTIRKKASQFKHIQAMKEVSNMATEAYDTDSFFDEVELVEYKGPISDFKPSKKRRSNSKKKTG